MPINAYTGLMGSGKSYEVTSNVILSAVKQGRRIVTNIDGINQDKIHEYLTAQNGGIGSDWGQILIVSNETVNAPNFWYYGKPEEAETLVQPGDMVVLDECWRFCGKGLKLDPHFMIFTREHRHFVDALKFTCDLVLICQHISDLHTSVKSVIELTFVTHKLKSLGLNKSYRLTIYEGHRTTSKPNSIQVKQYNKKFFEFYSSYAGGKGKEVAIDKRQNIFRNPKVFIGFPLLMIFAFTCLYFAYSFFAKKMGKQDQKPTQAQYAGQGGSASAAAPAIALPKDQRTIAPVEAFKIVGYYKNSSSIVYYIDIGNGQIQELYDIKTCSTSGLSVHCLLDDTHILMQANNQQAQQQEPTP